MPTVYADGFAGEVVAAVAEQKDHQVGELFHFAVRESMYRGLRLFDARTIAQ
jgi:hypothetical protein